MNPVDAFLNTITMYRLVLYYLTVLLLIALAEALFGILRYSPIDIFYTAAITTAVCWCGNEVLAKIFKAHPNVESSYITAFILALIMAPVAPANVGGALVIILASFAAMASKYIVAIRRAHIFNPAAFGAVIAGIFFNTYASWWVGTAALLPFVLIGGLLIVRKTQRFDLLASFALFALLSATLVGHAAVWWEPAWLMFSESAFFFFGCVMLTEPATMPPTRQWRAVYGAIVGLLYAPGIHVGSVYFSPEIALLIGNALAFVAHPKARLTLTLKSVEKTGPNTSEFVFATQRPLKFKAGQYLEWTLPHKPSDARGNRRYFTIASAPEDSDIRLGVKFYDKPSSFKRALARMKPGDPIGVSQLNGDFILSEDPRQKVAFIAGGIGITPFASMLRHLLARDQRLDAILLYSNKTPEDIAYRSVCEEAGSKLGIRTVYAIDKGGTGISNLHVGFIDAALIQKEIPDYTERVFYLSGPRSMILAFRKQLRDLGVPRAHIMTDFFPGLA